jgi:Uma2 family endonuclease
MMEFMDVRTLLTFEQFEQLPDQPGKRELLRGELIELPPAKLKHNRTAHRFYEVLKPALAKTEKPRRGLGARRGLYRNGLPIVQ